MYRIQWVSQDGSGDVGYLRSFDSWTDAVEYAREYARSVGMVREIRCADGLVLFAEKPDGYAERIHVNDSDA